MFNRKKVKTYEEPKEEVLVQNPEFSASTESIRNISKVIEDKYDFDDEKFEEIMKPSGRHKINPIVSINDIKCDYPVLINQHTGEAINNRTYYAELLDSVRSRATMLKERKGLEYEVIVSEDTPDEQKLDLLASNVESTDATLSGALADDILTSLHSVACNIEEKVVWYLDNAGAECHYPGDITLPSMDFLVGMFSWRYPNKSIDTYQISPATYFDFVQNRKHQIMVNYCTDVYNFLRSIAYNPATVIGPFDTRDTMYANLCLLIYEDLACLDDALSALITAHCVRIENCQTPARDAYKEVFDHKNPNLPKSN